MSYYSNKGTRRHDTNDTNDTTQTTRHKVLFLNECELLFNLINFNSISNQDRYLSKKPMFRVYLNSINALFTAFLLSLNCA